MKTVADIATPIGMGSKLVQPQRVFGGSSLVRHDDRKSLFRFRDSEARSSARGEGNALRGSRSASLAIARSGSATTSVVSTLGGFGMSRAPRFALATEISRSPVAQPLLTRRVAPLRRRAGSQALRRAWENGGRRDVQGRKPLTMRHRWTTEPSSFGTIK